MIQGFAFSAKLKPFVFEALDEVIFIWVCLCFALNASFSLMLHIFFLFPILLGFLPSLWSPNAICVSKEETGIVSVLEINENEPPSQVHQFHSLPQHHGRVKSLKPF